MKISLEPSNQETEVIIKGDIGSEEVQSILQYFNNASTVSTKVFLYKEDEQFIVDISEIVYFEAYNNKVTAVTEKEKYETKLKLYEIKDKFSKHHFAQINKSVIVNINYVKSVQAEFSGNYTIKLKNSKEILTISRKYFKDFKNQI